MTAALISFLNFLNAFLSDYLVWAVIGIVVLIIMQIPVYLECLRFEREGL